jgi:hypothetical protein
VTVGERTKRRRGRPTNLPAHEKAVGISTYVPPALYEWVRAEAVRQNRGMAPFVAELIAEMRRQREEETAGPAPNPPRDSLAP